MRSAGPVILSWQSIVIALPWQMLCRNFILPCWKITMDFFVRCPTSLCNQPLIKKTTSLCNGEKSRYAIEGRRWRRYLALRLLKEISTKSSSPQFLRLCFVPAYIYRLSPFFKEMISFSKYTSADPSRTNIHSSYVCSIMPSEEKHPEGVV